MLAVSILVACSDRDTRTAPAGSATENPEPGSASSRRSTAAPRNVAVSPARAATVASAFRGGGLNPLSPGQRSLSQVVATVQPATIEPASTCELKRITLTPPAGTSFPASGVVHFSPCGIAGRQVSWTGTRIVVEVPENAESGPVWIAAKNATTAGTLAAGAACLQNIRQLGSALAGYGGLQCSQGSNPLTGPRILRQLQGFGGGRTLPRASWQPGSRGLSSMQLTDGCKMQIPTGAAGVGFTALNATMQIDPQVARGCFASCTGVTSLLGGAARNHVTITHRPKLVRFYPRDASQLASDQFRVERGDVTFAWEVESDAGPATTALQVGSAIVGTTPAGSVTTSVTSKVDARLSAQNSCGAMTPRVLHVEPRSTLALTPSRLEIAPGQSAQGTISIPSALPTDVRVVVWATGTAGVTIQPTPVTIVNGQVSAPFTVSRSPGVASATAGAELALVFATPEGAADEALVVDAPSPLRVVGAAADAPPLVGMGNVRITGTLRYRKCPRIDFANVYLIPPAVDASGCLVTAAGTPDFRAIRRAQVEIWSSTNDGPWGIEVTTRTEDSGMFTIDRAYVNNRNYKIVVVASSPAGQVNWRDNAVVWFWKELPGAQLATSAGTLRFDWDATGSDAGNFSALDAMLTAWEYVRLRRGITETDAGSRLSRAIIIPALTERGVTLPAGAVSHIWVGAQHELLDDGTIVHEYAHHLQRMNGTYDMWPSHHNGCHITLDHLGCASRATSTACAGNDPLEDGGCWVNNEAHAWFEGFPTLFEAMVARWDAAEPTPRLALALFDEKVAFGPGGALGGACTCPLLTTPHTSWKTNATIRGSEVEHHIVRGFLALTTANGFAIGGVPASSDALESLLLSIAFDELRDHMPTYAEVRARWDGHFPGNPQTAASLSPFGL